MSSIAREIRSMSIEEVRNISLDMSALLDSGELLTGTPTIQTDSSIDISNAQVNTGVVTINGASVAAGNAVQFTANASSAGIYRIEILCDTDAGQTIEGFLKLQVKAGMY